MTNLRNSLLRWYDDAKRDLPWRRTNDPYAIWVSEIMLQQTQVATVIPYYERWMARFPTVKHLADANDQDVLAQWQGLGYYRRCRLLLEGARYLRRQGSEIEWPKTPADWRRVPGVGPYTAGAIVSIAFDKPAALVDGNVERVFSRLTACGLSESDLKRAAWAWAEFHAIADRPGDWNQALMELGATICKPNDPNCPNCPVRDFCEAERTGRQTLFPATAKKPNPVDLIHRCWIPFFDGEFGIRQIPPGEWWAGMWEFPRADTVPRELSTNPVQALGTIKHTVTHHRVKLHVSLVQAEKRHDGYRWVTPEQLDGIALPAPQRRALRLALTNIQPSLDL